MLKVAQQQQELTMKHPFELKVLGAIVILSEAVMMMVLLCMQFFCVYASARDAQTLTDCAWVAVFTVCIPAVAQGSGFLKALEDDWKHFRTQFT